MNEAKMYYAVLTGGNPAGVVGGAVVGGVIGHNM